MAISLLRRPFYIILFVLIVPYQAATQCQYGKYWDSSYNGCRNCSPCFKEVILGTSQDYAPMADCKKYKSLCPNWCSVETASISNPNEGRDACPPTTPSPPVPQVNVTIEEPQYNATANAYTVSCTGSFRDMSIPMLKWYGPSGQLLAPTDPSDKWKVTEGGVTQEVVTQEVVTQGIVSTTLLMKDFQEGDEGNYVCVAQGEQSDNRTVLLEYVEPPAITSTLSPTTPTTPPSQSSMKPKPTPGETNTPKGGLPTPGIIAIAVACAGFGVVLCGICAYLILKRRYPRRGTHMSIVTVADTEAHPLTGYSQEFLDRLLLETSDFKRATVKGIQALLDQPNCDAVIIKKNGKKIEKVCSNQDVPVLIKTLAWNDSIGVWLVYPHRNIWMKYFQENNELIKTLKMKCLKIGNVAETSALISCPSIENTFYMRFEEKNAPGCSSSAGPVELMHGGSKEMCNLRPNMTYCVHLGIKGQTRDSGDYTWCWIEEFTTRSIRIQSVTSAKLTLSEHSIPQSVQLRYEINQSKPQRMTGTEIPISSLIPGMEQVLQIKVEENVGGTSSLRLLQEMTFTISGSVEGGGDYRGYATTDFPDTDPEEQPGPSKPGRRKKRSIVPTKCGTGLLEGIHFLRDNDKFKQVYYHTEPCVLKAVLDSLLEFLKEHKKIIPNNKYVLKANGKQRGMENIEGFMREYDMQDYTGVFDLLKRFIHNDKVHTQAGVSFAEQLLDAHSSRTCHVCKHAVFLLRRYEKRHSHQSSVC